MKNTKKTEDKLIDSFKNLMEEYPFEKITVTMLAEKTHIIRSGFYSYFKDKYELMEYMLYNDITKEVDVLIKHNMIVEAIKLTFTQISYDKSLYRKLFDVVGQNNFEQIMITQFTDMMTDILKSFDSDKLPENKLLEPGIICRYVVIGLVTSIKEYLNLSNTAGLSASIDEAVEAYYFLVSHSIFDLFIDNLEGNGIEA